MKFIQTILFLFLTNITFSQIEIKATEAASHIGEKVLVKDAKIVSIYEKGQTVIKFNINQDYPAQDFTLIIYKDKLENFPKYKEYEGKVVSVMGEMKLYKNKYKENDKGELQIIINNPEQIEIN